MATRIDFVMASFPFFLPVIRLVSENCAERACCVSLWFPSFVFALLHFFCLFCLHECFQAGQVRAPESTVVLEPGIHSSQWFGIELINAVATFAMFAHQMRPAQQSQVLRDCRTRNWEGSRDVARWLASPPQQIENGATRGIGQSMKRRFRRICNRSVPHNA